MKQFTDYDDFAEIIREIARDETERILRENGFSRNVTGQVVATNNNRFSIDLADTIVDNIINKSGESLKPGDTVTLSERYGSNYSNCFISTKNVSDDAPTLNELKKLIESLQDRITELEGGS